MKAIDAALRSAANNGLTAVTLQDSAIDLLRQMINPASQEGPK